MIVPLNPQKANDYESMNDCRNVDPAAPVEYDVDPAAPVEYDVDPAAEYDVEDHGSPPESAISDTTPHTDLEEF